MKHIVKLTAVIMAAVCILSFPLIKTDYWYIGIAAFGIEVFWLVSFFWANLRWMTR